MYVYICLHIYSFIQTSHTCVPLNNHWVIHLLFIRYRSILPQLHGEKNKRKNRKLRRNETGMNKQNYECNKMT